MPEVVQDETVTETNPVKVEKLIGDSKTEEVKENGSSAEEKVAKNGHTESVKDSKAEEKSAGDDGKPSVESVDSTTSKEDAEESETSKNAVADENMKGSTIVKEEVDCQEKEIDSQESESKDNVGTSDKLDNAGKKDTPDKVDISENVEKTDKEESHEQKLTDDKKEIAEKENSSESVEDGSPKEKVPNESTGVGREQIGVTEGDGKEDKDNVKCSDEVDSSSRLVGQTESMEAETTSANDNELVEPSSASDPLSDNKKEVKAETSETPGDSEKEQVSSESAKPPEAEQKSVEEPSKGNGSSDSDSKQDCTAPKEPSRSSEKTNEEDTNEMEVDSSGENKNQVKGCGGESENKIDSEEKDEVAAGGSKGTETLEEIDSMITEGRAFMAKNNFNAAADLLGQACEKLREMFGELDDRCADCYYYYGSAMLECAKTENSVLGEGVNKEESESDDEEIPVVKEKEEEGDNKDAPEATDEKKEDEKTQDKAENNEADAEEKKVNVNGEARPSSDEPMETDSKESDAEPAKEDVPDVTLNKEDEEEEDTTLKAAWETLELAKFIFERQKNEKMLADTYMKLGEVAVESGHKAGIDDMKKSLQLRCKYYGENHRAIAETHFNIGLSYSLFEMFDEAIHQFDTSKNLLSKRIEMLEESAANENCKTEANELKALIPDLDEKIKDMKESKEEKAKADDNLKKKDDAAGGSGSADKAVSNLNHLVKRKRKIEEVAEALPEKDAKQACVEKESSS